MLKIPTIPKSAWKDPSARSSNHNRTSTDVTVYPLHLNDCEGLRVPQSDTRANHFGNISLIDLQLGRLFHPTHF